MITPIVARLRIDIPKDADEIDAKFITHWLMMFAGQLPLVLDDFRGGKIHFEGIQFSGSATAIYDQYMSRLLEDFRERWVRTAEDSLVSQLDADLEVVALQVAGLIESQAARLVGRARDVKTKLSTMHGQPSSLRLLPHDGPTTEERLLAQAANIRRQRNIRVTPTSVNVWLDFIRENKGPIAAIVAIVGVAAAILPLFVGG